MNRKSAQSTIAWELVSEIINAHLGSHEWRGVLRMTAPEMTSAEWEQIVETLWNIRGGIKPSQGKYEDAAAALRGEDLEW